MIRVAVYVAVVLLVGIFGWISWDLRDAEAQQRPPMSPTYSGGPGMPYGGQPAFQAPENVLIILDASYSMSEPMGGESKMALAKRAILQVLQRVPPHVNVGLRVYGTSTNTFNACSSTKLLVPIGPNNRQMIANEITRVKPRGATPISYTLSRAVREDFMGRPGKKTVILVSDGIETCGSDPCSVTVDMVRQGIDIKIDVIGFGVQDYAAIKQLRCIALATFGQFSTANTHAELARSLNNAMQADTHVQGQILLPNRNGTPSPPPPSGYRP